MDSKLDISLDGSSVNIVRKCAPALKDIIQMKFGCVATLRGVDLESGLSMAQQKKPTTVPEKRFSFVLTSGVQVSVWKADLTNFQVDAVVNAANTQLQHYGGLALALSEAGGPQIQKESDDYISRYGDLKTGDAIVRGAGSLPCKKIIHAVGPQLNKLFPNVSRAEPLLQKAIIGILDQVKTNHLNSVAIPAISSGLFNYPLTQCANTIVSTVKQYYQNSSPAAHVPQEVCFVNNDEPTVKEMERACRDILNPHMSMTYSQAAGGRSTGAAKTSTLNVDIGNVVLILKKGKIEEQQTDVIVNTASDRNLNSGQISKALNKKAGPGMQHEMRNAVYQGAIIPTKPYNLHCKEVYHTFCFENNKETMQEILVRSMLECLWRAAASQYKSIAFPAIGTGGLGLNKRDVALKMSRAVADFAQKYPNKMEVHFVIFPSDNDTFKAFEEQIRDLHQKTSHSNFTHVFEPRGDFHDPKPPTPQINLIGPSTEAVREAEQWLKGLLFSSSGIIHISNNFIQHFGEQEYLQLSRLTGNDISIKESFVKGRASITVTGYSSEEVVVAGLQVEAMLCKVQREFVTEEENAMFLMSNKKVSIGRKPINHSVPLFSDRVSAFRKEGLRVVKVEKVKNSALETLFDLKTVQLKYSNSQSMLQRIPAQFCEMVCHIGFHAECAPPEDPAYGEGIYFTRKVKKAMELWKEKNEKYLYFVEAEVLIGNSTHGKPGLILPPPDENDPQILYNSVNGGADISVIFSSYQALPKHIITCEVI